MTGTCFLLNYVGSHQRDEVYLQRLEVLEAAIERQSTGIRTFVPSVPMIGLDSNTRKSKHSVQDGNAGDNLNESGSMDADVMNSSGGSDVTEVMAELNDSGDDLASPSGR